MKKILFFINTLGTGGAEHVLVDIVNNLNPQKFDITIKTIYDINVYKNELNDNIKVESFYKTKKNKFIDKVFRKFLYLKIMHYSNKKLYKMFIKDKYDIEVAFLEGLPTKILSASPNKDSKKIAWVHTDLKNNTESYMFFKSLDEHKNTYKKYNEIYCVSDESKDAFYDVFNFKKNVYVLYNIIDKQKILTKSLEDAKLSDKFNIINVGRLTHQKGHIRLLNAYKNALSKIKKETHLYIIGDGPEKEKIELEIKKLNLSNNVTMLGRQDNPYKYVKNSNLYVCSSYAEGYSLVIMEALTLGIPVITTECAGMKQILNNGEFGLITENNDKSFEKDLIKIINNDKVLNNYQEKIKKNYSNYNKGIEKIEKELLK